MFEKEAEHLGGGVRSAGIGVRAGGAAARPGMAGAVNDPLLEYRLSARIPMEGTAVGAPAGRLPALDRRCQSAERLSDLGDDLIAVARVHRGIPIAMEHDRRDDPRVPRFG